MTIDMSEITDYPIKDVIRCGQNGLVKDIPPIFFDKLQDYIDEVSKDESEKVHERLLEKFQEEKEN